MTQKNKSKPRIVLTGGGTAGHITPLLAVAKEIINLTDSNVELHFIGQKGDKNIDLIESSELPIKTHYISAGKFRRYHDENYLQRLLDIKTNVLNTRDMARVVRGYFGAKRILKRLNPDVLFAKGGFVVVPVGKAANALRIPYITHDSDAIPGLANRLIAEGAVKNAVAHKGITVYPPEKTVVSGIPLSPEYITRIGADKKQYKKLLGMPDDSILLLVYTGTQGARIIDEALQPIVPRLMQKYQNLHVAHVFGRLNEQTMQSQYSDAGVDQTRIHKMLFVDNAYDYIAAADIIIGRAGATSTAEFAMIGRACIIVPADQLTGGHQLKNAQAFEKANAVIIVRESDISAIEQVCMQLIDNPHERITLEKAIQEFSTPDAARVLAKLVIDEARRNV